MDYKYGNQGMHQRPYNNGQLPFANSSMLPHTFGSFPQRGQPFRSPMPRGIHRRGGPPDRMMRPGFRSDRPQIKSHQAGIGPPYMMNRLNFSSQQRDGSNKVFDSTEIGFNLQQGERCKKFHGIIEQREGGLIVNSRQESILVCDSCDRNFPSETAYNKHMSEHKVCGLEGCTFSAHVKIIEKHIEMQHSTGIFERMRNLDSPENIAKWIEERKARFPSKENIEKRHKEQEELWKKGIRIGERKNKFGKDKTRLVRKDFQTRRKERDNFLKKKQEKKDKIIKKLQPKLLIDDKSDWNRNLPPFRGIIELFGEKDEEECLISDDEDDYIKRSTKIEDLVKINSSLGALMAYGSDYSEDDDELPNNDVGNKKGDNADQVCKKECLAATPENEIQLANNSDDEGPLEMKIERAKTLIENVKIEESTKKTRKRRLNNKNKDQKSCKIAKQNFPQPFPTRKISHLEKILDEDIRRERNIILQCVRHTVENNYFMNTK